MAIADAPTAVGKTAVKKEPKSGGRAGAPPRELREFERMLDSFSEKFPFAEEEIEKLRQKAAGVKDAWRRAEQENAKDHERVRAKLNTMFNGKVELWIKKSTDEELKAFFRRLGWRV